MPRPISHSRLMAEALAFPFSSESSFHLRIGRLSRHASGVLDDSSTTDLANALENHLRPRAAGMSLELLRQIRDASWFPYERHSVLLDEHLRLVASRYLENGGNRIRLRCDDDIAECAVGWRWLSLYLPADLLIAGFTAQEPHEPHHEAVLVVTPRLAEMLREPCAETHLHVGAGVPFGLLWASRMRALATEPDLKKLKPSAGPPPFAEAGGFHAKLLAAATVRHILAAFLRYRESTLEPESFRPFLNNHGPTIAAQIPWGLGAHAALRGLHSAIMQLCGQNPTQSIGQARRLYQALIGRPPNNGPPQSIQDVQAADPLATWLPAREGLALPETRFAWRALQYLAGLGRGDDPFALLFWQYQRIRCLTYRFLVEEPGTAGLDWFTRHYARISPLRGTLANLTYASALEVQSRDLCLASLEARTAPEPFWIDVRDEVRRLARQAATYNPLPGREQPEVALVLHFIKEWDRVLPNKRRQLHADPRQTTFGCRFGAWFHERHRQALAISKALEQNPELLLVLRGVDVANVELAEPTWPLLPLFAQVRRASQRASARLARLRPRWEVTPLRVTIHAGEDFRRLVEGLRRIHELIEFNIVQVGDRIGHGVALGEDPVRWAQAAQRVMQPAEERLDDLLWELTRYQCGDIPTDAGRLEYVRAEAVRLGREIYRDNLDADDLITARRLRHDLNALSSVGYPFIGSRNFSGPRQWFYRYLTDAAVFERGQHPIEVNADEHEIKMLQWVQRWLRRELGRREITVECNPSSNLIIADYLSLDEHAAFRMQPLPHMRKPDEGTTLVSVNTDNPITFASCLADEFAHLYFALIGRGVPVDEALAWLDRARENGYRSRFSLRASSERILLNEVARR